MQFDQLKRREFITLLGGAAAVWPLAARAQQMPVIGFLDSSVERTKFLAALQQGLGNAGYLVGQNVAIEYRWARGDYGRLPTLAAELMQLPVNVLVGSGTPAALAAKAATSKMPIVFSIGIDPVSAGVVRSLNRPGGNATGVYFLTSSLEAKRLQLLQEVVPTATVIGILVNPDYSGATSQLKDASEGARALGLDLRVLKANSVKGIDVVFESAVEQHIGALLVGSDPLFFVQREQIVALAARHTLPTIYFFPEFVYDGGLMSYGTNLTDVYSQVGVYTGRILKGERPDDLPVQQSVKVELVINLKAAKALGLSFPITLLARADEVIE
jgi:putative tryptophan/tyrosine transport system substrate-binding protein